MTEQDTGRSQRAEAQPPKAALSAEQKKMLQAKHRVEEAEARRQKEHEAFEKEKQLQRAVLHIHKKYGKNALLKGMNLLDGATMQERNEQVGGHKA